MCMNLASDCLIMRTRDPLLVIATITGLFVVGMVYTGVCISNTYWVLVTVRPQMTVSSSVIFTEFFIQRTLVSNRGALDISRYLCSKASQAITPRLYLQTGVNLIQTVVRGPSLIHLGSNRVESGSSPRAFNDCNGPIWVWMVSANDSSYFVLRWR